MKKEGFKDVKQVIVDFAIDEGYTKKEANKEATKLIKALKTYDFSDCFIFLGLDALGCYEDRSPFMELCFKTLENVYRLSKIE